MSQDLLIVAVVLGLCLVLAVTALFLVLAMKKKRPWLYSWEGMLPDKGPDDKKRQGVPISRPINAYKVCKNCGAHAKLGELFCVICGSKL